MKKHASRSRHSVRRKRTHDEIAQVRAVWSSKMEPPDFEVPITELVSDRTPDEQKELEALSRSSKIPAKIRAWATHLLEVRDADQQQRSTGVGTPEWALIKLLGQWLIARYEKKAVSV